MTNTHGGGASADATHRPGGAGDPPPTAIDRLFRRIDPEDDAGAGASTKPRRIDVLERTIKTLVIPKLVVMHSERPEPGPVSRSRIVTQDEARRFRDHVLAHDMASCVALVERLIGAGDSLAALCLDLFAPTARDLGILWEEDRVSFVDVTTGLGLLHTLLHRAAELCPTRPSIADPSRRVLLASLSGEQHEFGLRIVAELFRQSGWDVVIEPSITEATLSGLVADSAYAIVGLSIADDAQLDRLAAAIHGVRKASRNDTVGVIVGGPVFVARPELALSIGADLTASDADQAVFRAEGLRVLLATWA